MTRWMTGSLRIACVASLLACRPAPDSRPTDEAGAPPNVTVLSISGHSLEAPDTIDAGWTTFRFANEGDDIHYAHIVRLDSARTVSELLAAYAEAIRTSGPRPAWVRRFGGPGGAEPGDTSVVTQYLEPGEYVWICPVEDDAGNPHFGKGEFRPFVVRAGDAATHTAAPVATRVIHLQDYGFILDVPLRAGRQTIRVVNDGPEPHDINLMKLMPGKTVDDVRAWLNPERARRTDPGGQSQETATTLVTGVGGVAAIKPGMEAYFEADLTPGDYVLACMVTAPDGRSHIEHGMIRQILVD